MEVFVYTLSMDLLFKVDIKPDYFKVLQTKTWGHPMEDDKIFCLYWRDYKAFVFSVHGE